MSASVFTYGSLLLAIVCETIGTSFLKQSEQFSKVIPTLAMVVSYLCSFFLLSLSLKTLPIGIAYAMWSGLGIVLITLIGLFVFKQQLDLPAYAGLGMIVAGVIVINVFSNATGH